MEVQELWRKTKRARAMKAEGFELADIAKEIALSEDAVRKAIATFRVLREDAGFPEGVSKEEPRDAVAGMFGR